MIFSSQTICASQIDPASMLQKRWCDQYHGLFNVGLLNQIFYFFRFQEKNWNLDWDSNLEPQDLHLSLESDATARRSDLWPYLPSIDRRTNFVFISLFWFLKWNKWKQTYNLCLVELQFQISREKFELGLGFERRTSRSQAWRSTFSAIPVQLVVQA